MAGERAEPGGGADVVAHLTDAQLETCWYAALAFGSEGYPFYPKPCIEHLGAALRHALQLMTTRALAGGAGAEEGEG